MIAFHSALGQMVATFAADIVRSGMGWRDTVPTVQYVMLRNGNGSVGIA